VAKKKTSAAEYKPVRNGGSGRPNNTEQPWLTQPSNLHGMVK